MTQFGSVDPVVSRLTPISSARRPKFHLPSLLPSTSAPWKAAQPPRARAQPAGSRPGRVQDAAPRRAGRSKWKPSPPASGLSAVHRPRTPGLQPCLGQQPSRRSPGLGCERRHPPGRAPPRTGPTRPNHSHHWTRRVRDGGDSASARMAVRSRRLPSALGRLRLFHPPPAQPGPRS